MTRLNDHQQALLDAIGQAKVEVDEAIAVLKSQHDEAVWALKAPVREAVEAAVAEKVPARRIGFMLDTSDHKTIKSYFPVADGGNE